MKLNIKEMKWCWENGIKINPFPLASNGSILKIQISKNGNETLGEKRYTKNNIHQRINEMYKEIYEKNIIKSQL
ncbi:hypothetical protein [uncultured Tenacibaculum sp.]|uniref:hypothetical protein n=1 Tax=uncultured Tenacibaculum sp. TaxID=174713 RepID=UPI00261234D9|nr:hypothetical protein [uncultured Tenacibaculum sp.]